MRGESGQDARSLKGREESAMHPPTCRLIAGDEAVLGLSALSPGERIAAAFLSLAVRLWCLPVLLLVWLLTWTAILLVRLACLIKGAGRSRGEGLPAGSKSRPVWRISPGLCTGQDKVVL
jgi:hypothetical protein